MPTAPPSPACSRCRRTNAVPLARDGDIQRFQCLPCGATFIVPVAALPAPKPESPAPVPVPPRVAAAPPAVEAPAEAESAARPSTEDLAATVPPAPEGAPQERSTSEPPSGAPAAEEDGDAPPKATCRKCGRPFKHLGHYYDKHTAECDGTPYVPVERKPREIRRPAADGTPASAPPSDVRSGPHPFSDGPSGGVLTDSNIKKSILMSIEALRLRRSALEGEIRGIDNAIRTLQSLEGHGGVPAGPTALGA